jgi:hypothetical protein
MNLADDSRADAITILRNAGFTSAWVLETGDPSDVVFLVPRNEGDVAPIVESPSIRAVVRLLMGVIPNSKVAVAANREGLKKTRLY